MAGTYGGQTLMPYRENSDESKLGKQGEAFVRAWLKRQGFYIVPTSLIVTGGAPMLEGSLRKHILPDVLAAKGTPRWVEIKTKSKSTPNQKRRRNETGIPLRHWEAYKAVQEHTGIPGFLCFLHLKEKRVYLGALDEIGKDSAIYRGPKFPEPEIFFDLNRFNWDNLGSNLQRLLPEAIPPKIIHPWEKRLSSDTRQPKLL